jgi:hypothetical protein
VPLRARARSRAVVRGGVRAGAIPGPPCYFPIEHLLVPQRVEMAGVVLLRTDDAEVPSGWALAETPTVGGVMAIPVSGTSTARMRDRAREKGDHVLRLLRVGLRDHPAVHESQLRFRLADVYEIRRVGRGYVIGTAGHPWAAAFQPSVGDSPSSSGCGPSITSH